MVTRVSRPRKRDSRLLRAGRTWESERRARRIRDGWAWQTRLTCPLQQEERDGWSRVPGKAWKLMEVHWGSPRKERLVLRTLDTNPFFLYNLKTLSLRGCSESASVQRRKHWHCHEPYHSPFSLSPSFFLPLSLCPLSSVFSVLVSLSLSISSRPFPSFSHFALFPPSLALLPLSLFLGFSCSPLSPLLTLSLAPFPSYLFLSFPLFPYLSLRLLQLCLPYPRPLFYSSVSLPSSLRVVEYRRGLECLPRRRPQKSVCTVNDWTNRNDAERSLSVEPGEIPGVGECRLSWLSATRIPPAAFFSPRAGNRGAKSNGAWDWTIRGKGEQAATVFTVGRDSVHPRSSNLKWNSLKNFKIYFGTLPRRNRTDAAKILYWSQSSFSRTISLHTVSLRALLTKEGTEFICRIHAHCTNDVLSSKSHRRLSFDWHWKSLSQFSTALSRVEGRSDPELYCCCRYKHCQSPSVIKVSTDILKVSTLKYER